MGECDFNGGNCLGMGAGRCLGRRQGEGGCLPDLGGAGEKLAEGRDMTGRQVDVIGRRKCLVREK